VRAYKWFLPGRIDPLSESDEVWPDPSAGKGWVKMSGLLGRSRTSADTIDAIPSAIWNELWEVEVDSPRAEASGVVFAKRGRLVRQITSWDDSTAQRLCEEWSALRSKWADEILSLIPQGAEPSKPIPTFLMSSIMSSAALAGEGLSPASQQVNRIIRRNVADAFVLAMGEVLPPETTQDGVIITAKLVQQGCLSAAGALAFAKHLSEVGTVPADFNWYPVMRSGRDDEYRRQVQWFKITLSLSL
jgi:hypothetical protein